MMCPGMNWVMSIFCRLTRNGSWRQLKIHGTCSRISLLDYGINTKKEVGRRTCLIYTTTQTCWALLRRSTWQTYFMIALGLVQPKWSGNYRVNFSIMFFPYKVRLLNKFTLLFICGLPWDIITLRLTEITNHTQAKRIKRWWIQFWCSIYYFATVQHKQKFL